MAEPFATSIEGDIVAGPLRRPRNAAKNEKGSIHEDATALKLGFRGGTVAGSLHMEQFPPLLEHLFGEQWWDTGGLSLYFRYATTDREGVQAFGIVPHSNRTEVWMDDQRGTRIADGTANVRGLDPESALRHRIEAVPAATDLRITCTPRSRDALATLTAA